MNESDVDSDEVKKRGKVCTVQCEEMARRCKLSELRVRKKIRYGRGWFRVAVAATLLQFAKAMEVGFGEKEIGKGKGAIRCGGLYFSSYEPESQLIVTSSNQTTSTRASCSMRLHNEIYPSHVD